MRVRERERKQKHHHNHKIVIKTQNYDNKKIFIWIDLWW